MEAVRKPTWGYCSPTSFHKAGAAEVLECACCPGASNLEPVNAASLAMFFARISSVVAAPSGPTSRFNRFEAESYLRLRNSLRMLMAPVELEATAAVDFLKMTLWLADPDPGGLREAAE
jgi:hypothetical protein